MRKSPLSFAMAVMLAAGACASPEVVVTVEIDVASPDGDGTVTRALESLEVRLIPFDRDAVFDSLQAAFPTPEPEVPQDLLDAREEVRIAQEHWQEAERRWNTVRDTLQKISAAMENYNRGEARYLALFREFGDFEGQLGGVEREMNTAFERFDSLQRGTIRQADSVRIQQENWADDAFADVDLVFLAKQRESGRDIAVDTTDANGIARSFHVNAKVEPGQYWVVARFEQTYSEFYWNVPITVEAGEPVQVRLSNENAEVRLKL